MTTKYIQALGNLLATYQSDLIYIRDFHRHKNKKYSTLEYLNKSAGTFKSFVNEFRVARNIDKTKTDVLLSLTIDWIYQPCSDNVDEFANQLKSNGITHGKIMTSLASKILFLNNPWIILPLDSLAKKALKLKTNRYASYLPLTEIFKQENKTDISNSLASVDEHLAIIEKDFENEVDDLKVIRHNRFVDKLLWTTGRM